jgi:putative tryptophan/tyrosine transport system substrate-binding protein
MRRREFVTLLGGAALCSLPVRAQQPGAIQVIGFINGQTPAEFCLAVFHRGLNETGYVEHRNVGIEYRWAGGHDPQLARSSSPTPGAVEAGLTAGIAKPDYNRSRNVG